MCLVNGSDVASPLKALGNIKEGWDGSDEDTKI